MSAGAQQTGTEARIDMLAEQLREFRERFERFEDRMDRWTQHHDGAHVLLAKTTTDDAKAFAERLTWVEAGLSIRSMLLAGWNALLTAVLGYLGFSGKS